MNEETLLIFIKFALVALGILWISIGTSLFYRKNRNFKLKLIENTFADIVSRYLYNDPRNPLELIEIQRSMHNIGIKKKNPNNVQYLIGLMIRTQRSVLGQNYERLKVLYSQIPPYKASIRKVEKRNWYKQACGIREIYEMDQSQYLKRVQAFRNHKNIYVRREAQIALVVFLGWESIRFMPYLKRNLTLWQQIKIVEKLHDLYPRPEIKWLHRVYGTEKVFAIQLLMRIIRKYELHEEVDYIINNLNHENYEIRETAIYCLSTFAVNSKKMKKIKEIFEIIPNSAQQALLLEYILDNSDIDLDFYLKQLYIDNANLKLKVADILWNNGFKEKVQEFYYQQYSKVEANVG